MRRIKEKYGATIFLTTHYLEEAQELSDYICILKNGNIAAQGTIDRSRKIHKSKDCKDRI